MKLLDPRSAKPWISAYRASNGAAVYVQKGIGSRRLLYRYMKAADFFRTLADGALFFQDVEKWTDPYEEWWSRLLFCPGSKLSGVRAYGSCWTRNAMEEPFWRLYANRCAHVDAAGQPLAPAPPPIRIAARVSALVAVLSAFADRHVGKAFIGEVAYCPAEAIRKYAPVLRGKSYETASSAATGLHLKRRAFAFEREMRLLWIERDAKATSQSVPLRILDVVEDVMIGPTRDNKEGKRLRDEIIGLGVPESRVRRSLIYAPV